MTKYEKGFTLVELLVVIGVILLIAAIVFPVYSNARNHAITSIDISNLHQLGMAVRMYQQDNEGFPAFPGCLKPYTKSEEVFICPVDPTKGEGYANWPPGYPHTRCSYKWIYLRSLVHGLEGGCLVCSSIYERHTSDYPLIYDLIHLNLAAHQTYVNCGSSVPIFVLRGDGRLTTFMQSPCGRFSVMQLSTGEGFFTAP